MKKTNSSILKILLKLIKIIVVIVVVFAVVNITYAFLAYSRIPDYTELEIQNSNTNNLNKTQINNNSEYKAISFNTGFSAYLPEFSFFMEGGSESCAKSENSVVETTENIADVLKDQNADFISLQEVDSDSTRTYHIDETKMIQRALKDYYSVNCVCFNSPYLFWPPWQPHGQSTSNLMTMSKFKPSDNALRRQFPVDNSFTKILDYDRCYSITRFPTSDGKELVYYTTHMSAYSKDPSTAENQIKQIIEDMQNEYNKGNYCICGADLNKQVVDNPQNYYPANKINEIESFPTEFLENTNINIVAPFDKSHPVPSCRSSSKPWGDDCPVCNIDGFLISSNVKVLTTDVVDLNFQYSDHNPVYMTFKLI